MVDGDIFGRINALSEEEEELWEHAGDGHGLTAEEHERLESIKVELDRAYDLLHQRAAEVRNGKLAILNDRWYRSLVVFLVEWCGNLEHQHDF